MIFGSASLTKSPRTDAGPSSLKRPVVVDRLEHRPPMRPTDRQVLRTERGGEVHDPGAVVHGDEVAADDLVRPLDVRIQRLVARHRRGRIRAASRPRLLPRRAHAGGGRHRSPAVRRPRPPRRTRRRRPPRGLRWRAVSTAWWSTRGGRRPRIRERGIALAATRKPDEHAGVLHGLVAHGDLGVGERGAASGAIRRDLVGLHEQAAFVHPLQRPPHRLDVLGVHRPVRVGHVDPEADAIRQPFELTDVAGHRFRHRRLNSAIPNASMSRFPVVPISFSTSSSTGSPWQSQPPFRARSDRSSSCSAGRHP